MKIGALYSVKIPWSQHRVGNILLLVKYEEKPCYYTTSKIERHYTFLIGNKLEVLKLAHDPLKEWMKEI